MRTFIFLVLLLFHSAITAQHLRLIEFGAVTTQEMRMSFYEKDSTASAVVLHDKGYFDGIDMEFTRHVRIKVLSHAGTSFANFTIRVPSKSFIDGYTFNMQNGLLKKTKLENSNIYNEEVVDGFDVYKVFFPEVKAGSVIDFRYKHMGLPFEWRFQDVIPVRYSELTLERTTNVHYKKVFYGFEKISESENGSKFIAEYMPAIRQEPFMNHYSNYVTRFQFDIETVFFPRWNFYRDFSAKWENVGKRLMEHEYFGGVIRGCSFLNEKAREIEQSDMPVTEKINVAFNYIRDNIKWNHNFAVIAPRSFREDFKSKHSGNSATINLLLIGLLKKAGIDAFPVVLSTRDNGMINPLNASLNKLNYVLAYVKHQDVSMLIDASNPHTIPGVVPDHCLNLVGWLIEGDERGSLIDLSPGRASTMKRFVMIKPNEANELVAEVTNSYEGYAYLDWVAEFEKSGTEKNHGNVLSSKNIDIPIDGYTLLSQDKGNLKASERMVVRLSEAGPLQAITEDEYALNPFIFNDIVNPFKSGDRLFPIDFIYPRRRSIIVSMALPPGYALKSFPQSSRLDSPDEKAKFVLLTSVNNNILNIRCDFAVTQTLFTEDEYAFIKTFYAEVINKLSESVQIIKTM